MLDRRLWQILDAPALVSEQPQAHDWSEIEERFCPLPDDFKAFLTAYGTGSVDGFIWIFNPASGNKNLNLGYQIEEHLAALRESFVPGLALHPTHRGMLPFGATDNGDLLGWEVHGDPNQWKVVVVDSHAPEFKIFEVGFSQFLSEVLSKQLICSIFPDDFPSDRPTFSRA